MVTSTFHTVAAGAILMSAALLGTAQPQPAGNPPPPPPPAQPAPDQPAEPARPIVMRERQGARDERMSVGAAMKLIGRSYDKLRDQIGDAAKRDDNLRLVNDMQRGAVNAKAQPVPADVLKHAADDAARATVSENYRKDLVTLMRKLLDVETEIAEGKLDDARAHLEEAIKIGDAAHGRLPHPEQE